MISGRSCINKFSIQFANLICRQEMAGKPTKGINYPGEPTALPQGLHNARLLPRGLASRPVRGHLS